MMGSNVCRNQPFVGRKNVIVMPLITSDTVAATNNGATMPERGPSMCRHIPPRRQAQRANIRSVSNR
jgi:hypothetical protein